MCHGYGIGPGDSRRVGGADRIRRVAIPSRRRSHAARVESSVAPSPARPVTLQEHRQQMAKWTCDIREPAGPRQPKAQRVTLFNVYSGATRDLWRGGDVHWHPTLSPDGRHIAAAMPTRDSHGRPHEIQVLRAYPDDGGPPPRSRWIRSRRSPGGAARTTESRSTCFDRTRRTPFPWWRHGRVRLMSSSSFPFSRDVVAVG